MKSKQYFGQNLGGTDHIGVLHSKFLGGRVSPVPPVIYAPADGLCL